MYYCCLCGCVRWNRYGLAKWSIDTEIYAVWKDVIFANAIFLFSLFLFTVY